jgi:hypothetical protein
MVPLLPHPPHHISIPQILIRSVSIPPFIPALCRVSAVFLQNSDAVFLPLHGFWGGWVAVGVDEEGELVEYEDGDDGPGIYEGCWAGKVRYLGRIGKGGGGELMSWGRGGRRGQGGEGVWDD